MKPHITAHAISRYRERVSPVDYDTAHEALSSATICKAVEIGAPYVKLGTGQHVVIVNGSVVTVLPEDIYLELLAHGRMGNDQ